MQASGCVSLVGCARWQVRGLSLEDRYRFAMSPCNTRIPSAMAALLHFATAYAARTPVPLDMAVPERVPANSEELRRLEESYQVLRAAKHHDWQIVDWQLKYRVRRCCWTLSYRVRRCSWTDIACLGGVFAAVCHSNAVCCATSALLCHAGALSARVWLAYEQTLALR